MMKKEFGLILLLTWVVPTAATTANIQCDGALWDLVEEGHDIIFGEGHGSVEVPALMNCLVEKRVALLDKEPLIVALEFKNLSLDPESESWYGKDGRNSESMWQLMQYLISQQQDNKLNLYMMIEPVTYDMPFDQNRYEQQIGEGLSKQLPKGQVIALIGNFHSRKSSEKISNGIVPAGSYVTDSMLHIAIEAVNDGKRWSCVGGGCGVNFSPKFLLAPLEMTTQTTSDFSEIFRQKAEVGKLINGQSIEHDYIYFLNKFSASPPKYVKD